MAPQQPRLSAIAPPDFLSKVYRIAELEGGIATFASMLNRYHNPAFGKDYRKWLTPGQYEVLKSSPPKGAGERLRRQLETPQGMRQLIEAGQALGGVTDFRSTEALRDSGNLTKYPDNLIPVLQGGKRIFVTPKELREKGFRPDLKENTFFNETKRPPTLPWWQQLGGTSSLTPEQASEAAASTAATPPGAGAMSTDIRTKLADLLANEFLNRTISDQNQQFGYIPPEFISAIS